MMPRLEVDNTHIQEVDATHIVVDDTNSAVDDAIGGVYAIGSGGHSTVKVVSNALVVVSKNDSDGEGDNPIIGVNATENGELISLEMEYSSCVVWISRLN